MNEQAARFVAVARRIHEDDGRPRTMTAPTRIQEPAPSRSCRCGAPRTVALASVRDSRAGAAWRRWSGCERCGDKWAFEELASGAREVRGAAL